MKALRRTFSAIATLSISIGNFTFNEAAAQPVPSVRVVSAPLLTPAQANAHYGTAILHTHGTEFGYGVNTTQPRPPEIKELARALKNDPDLIFEYVRNNIRVTYSFGLQKGALGAIIDRSGTPFDQAQLLVELFREAGLAASYRYGTIALTGAQFTAWTGVSDAKLACQLLASGGIPGAINGSTNASCAYTGAVTSATVGHIWVQTTIGGTSYLFDPAYKPHTINTRVNLEQLMGFVAGSPLADATKTVAQGGTLVQGAEPITGGPAPWFREVPAIGVSTYITNLLTHIRTNAKDALLEDLIGGEVIQQAAIPVGGFRLTSLPYTATASATWAGDIPDQFRTKLRVSAFAAYSFPATSLDAQFYVDEIYGRRMRLDTNFDWATAQQANSPLYQAATTSSGGMTISLSVDGPEA